MYTTIFTVTVRGSPSDGLDYICFLHFLLAHHIVISIFAQVKVQIWHQLARFQNRTFTFILSNLNNFHPLKVLDRVSEAHLQACKNSNLLI